MAVHHQHKEQEQSHIPRRLNILFFIVFLFFAALILRLAIVQLVHGEEYRAMSDNTQKKIIPITAPRGFIKDRNGKPLVTNNAVFSITYLRNKKSDIDNNTIADRLAPHIGMKTEDILKEMEAPGYGFVPKHIKTDLTEQEVAWVSEHQRELPGISVIAETLRNYMYGPIASHILGYTGKITPGNIEEFKAMGYTGTERVGVAGVENYYEKALHGKSGQIEVEVNSNIEIVKTLKTVNPQRGNDLLLTIDIDFQKKVEQLVAERLKEIQTRELDPLPKVKEAIVIVERPKTGEILAMVSYPGVDPNLWNYPMTPEIYLDKVRDYESNKAIRGYYAPGSTVKPITVMMGLQEGIINRYTTVYDPGYLQVGNKKLKNWTYNRTGGGAGTVDPVRALKLSNNTFMYQVAMWLAKYPQQPRLYKKKFETFHHYNEMFGLGIKTGIDLPGEKTKLSAYSEELGNLAFAAIGQHDSFTAMQLVNYVSTIANDGVRVRPHLLKEIQKGGIRPEDPGQTVAVKAPEVINKVDIDPEYVKIAQQGMAAVTEPGGTGYGTLGHLPIRVAAKTGTAQTGFGVIENSLIVGYAPVVNPEIAFTIIIPGGGGGSTSSGPLAREIVKTYFGIE